MGRLYVLLFFAEIALTVVALISCLSAEDGELRALPRWAWIIIILLFPLVGSIAYLVAGKPVKTGSRPGTWRPGSGFPERERPKRPIAPDDDPEFLRQLDARSKQDDEDLMKRWEEDLKRREDDLRKKSDDTPPDG
jgi:hypothetical protein